MLPTVTLPSPRQTFEDNMRPATLLLRVYRLLDSNDTIQTEGSIVSAMRQVVRASANEDLMLIYNELFLGLVREHAQLPISTLRRATLCHLLRQSVVASCTALETYLPALLRANLPIMIRAKGRGFVPQGDTGLQEYFSDLQFNLYEMLGLLSDPQNAPESISNKILNLTKFKYLSSRKGIHVTGALLGLSNPWEEIAAHLHRDRKELMTILEATVYRRNDIVHRADRAQDAPAGEAQGITFSWTQQAVDTIEHICLALDELVATHIEEIQPILGER